MEEYTDMDLEEFNKYLTEALAKIPPEDKIKICNNLEIILVLDFRKFQERECHRAIDPRIEPDNSRYFKHLKKEARDINGHERGGATVAVTNMNEPGRIVLINLFYEEIIDFLGHEFAHVWYNHPEGLNCSPEAYQSSYTTLDDLAKAKAGKWGFNPELNFTPRRSI